MRVRFLPVARARRRVKLVPLLAFFIALTIYGFVQVNFDWRGAVGGRGWDSVEEGLVEEGSGKCEQRYPREAQTELNTFEMYKNEMTSPGGTNEFNKRLRKGKGPLRVFVLPMTHVDPGWLKTFDDYAVETNRILDNMLSFMKDHPRMRFLWCEMVFFHRWWDTLDDAKKDHVKKLVESGQLEMASGSWVMTDEANPFFPVTLDNIIDGQQFVFNQLGVKPRTMWSNDPFGYGSTVPYLFSKTGVRWAVINRIHHPMKNYMQGLRAIPFNWRQYFDREGRSDVYTHVLPYTHYDILNSCGPSSSVCCEFDFKRITHFSCPGNKPVPITSSNVAQKASLLEDQLHQMSEMYESDVMVTVWGDDFRYGEMEEWHQQYDNLAPIFDHINKGDKTKIEFGTFTDYFTALEAENKRNSIEPPSLSGDFFPYQCALGDTWTGYYTTRPFYKRQGRILHALIRAADVASAGVWVGLDAGDRRWVNDQLAVARRNLSLFQHHDAITGTSKKSVMKNYSQLLFTSMHTAAAVLEKTTSAPHSLQFNINEMPLKYTEIASKKLIVLLPGNPVSVCVLNSVERRRVETLSVMVSSPAASVLLGDRPVKAQIEPLIDPRTGTLTAYFKLVFRWSLPPLSTQVFTIVCNTRNDHTAIAHVSLVAGQSNDARIRANDFPRVFEVKSIPADQFSLHTKAVRTRHSATTGLLQGLVTGSIGDMQLVQTVDHYVDSGGGPYLMQESGDAQALELRGLSRFVVKGPLQQSAFIHSQHFQQALILHDLPGVEGEQLHLRMRVDIRSMKQVEVITRFSADLDAASTRFYTDSNGLQLLRREKKERSPVKASYYPMPTSAVLQDRNRRVTILSDVEHGATLHAPTTAEIMLDRLLLQDDGKGLGYGEDSILNDILPVDIRFTLLIERIQQANRPNHFAYHTPLAHMALQALLYKPILLTAQGAKSSEPSPTLPSFPCDVQVLTCRPHLSLPNKRLLMLFRPGTDCTSIEHVHCPATDLTSAIRGYLKHLGVSKAQRTTVNGLDELGEETEVDAVQLALKPMDFATFLITFP